MRIQLILVVAALGCLTAPSWAQVQVGWVTFSDERGTRVEYPADVFPVTRDGSRGRTFVTSDGRATLDIYSGPNDKGESPAQLLD